MPKVINWKTTLPGVIAAASSLLNIFGVITISPEVQGAILTVALFFIALFAKDNDVTGGTKTNS